MTAEECIFVGSHKLDKCPPPEILERSLQVQVKPGTAVLFDRRMWHCRGKNTSDIAKSDIYRIQLSLVEGLRL